jgi:hypothetical protein
MGSGRVGRRLSKRAAEQEWLSEGVAEQEWLSKRVAEQEWLSEGVAESLGGWTESLLSSR